MANRDYVKRGQGSRKSTNRKKTPSKKPWKAGLLAIFLAAGFGYVLYILNNDPEPITPEPKTTKAQPTTEQPSTLPTPPKEEWDYVKTLPNKEIKIEAKQQVVSQVPYIMQCGAFKTLSQAEERKVNIAFQGISSKIRSKEGSSWYKVVLGPYKFKRDAEKDKHILQRAKIEPCAIWKDAQ
ncbi:SPOR domain-containing protein [Vibrio sp. MA40-2]|uniref:SPOR domain-containing protein n=1 Tax=Vibrio sp. MA40-2 TaxID=3391828 RepID=UPI0039A4DF60